MLRKKPQFAFFTYLNVVGVIWLFLAIWCACNINSYISFILVRLLFCFVSFVLYQSPFKCMVCISCAHTEWQQIECIVLKADNMDDPFACVCVICGPSFCLLYMCCMLAWHPCMCAVCLFVYFNVSQMISWIAFRLEDIGHWWFDCSSLLYCAQLLRGFCLSNTSSSVKDQFCA